MMCVLYVLMIMKREIRSDCSLALMVGDHQNLCMIEPMHGSRDWVRGGGGVQD